MSIPHSTLFLSVIVLSLFSSQTLHCVADVGIELAQPDISSICEKSIDRPFCLNFLKTTPGISSADLKVAGVITLDTATAEATATQKYINTLLGQPSDPMAENYKTCLSNYEDAVDNIQASKGSLNIGDYNAANIQASAAQEDADTCDEGVKGTELSNKNQHLFKVLGIVLIIANQLRG
ncbi:Pectinesterase inhibitor [Linum perenne]